MAPSTPRVPGLFSRATPGVGWIRTPMSNVYCLCEGASTYLIDAGFRGNARHIEAAFRRAGIPLAQVSNVLLTHQHPDHMGGAAYLRWVAGAPVACHTMEVPAVEGRGPRLSPFLVRLLFPPHPVSVDRPLHDGDRVGPFQVVHTPGHTLGSVAFYHPERKLLFAGDAVITQQGRVRLALGFSNFDVDTAVESVSKLAELEVESLFCGHGAPILRHASDRLKEAAKHLNVLPTHKHWTLAGPEGRPETHPRPSSVKGD